jgi:diguanylate cyclase (GGDEF)-like protein/PAS domain S-box-containing protein
VQDLTSRFFDWLLPARYQGDPELRFRAELVLGFGAFELLGAAMFSVAELAWGAPAIGVIYTLAMPPMFAILVWARRGGNATHAGTAFTAVLLVAITAVNFGTGGRAIGANISLPTVVLFGVLMSSPRAGLVWTSLVVAEIVVVSFLRHGGYDAPIKTDPHWVGYAIDRVPLLLSLISALIGVVTLRVLSHFRTHLELARATESTAHANAANSAARFADFAEIAADGFWETDPLLRLSYVSPSFAQTMGLEVTQMIGLTPVQSFLLRFPDAPDLSRYMEPMHARQSFDSQLLRTIDRAGKARVLLNHGRPAYDSEGNFIGYRGAVQDITELKKVERELRILTQIDSLTGLANRSRFNARLVDAIARSERTGELMALAFLDLDRFKSINDSLGHKAGDLVLQEFAKRLTHCMRQIDTVARLAGDEFVIVLEGLHRAEDATTVAKKILSAMKPNFDILGQGIEVSATIGIAVRRTGEVDGENLLRRADEALYVAKAAERGTFRVTE